MKKLNPLTKRVRVVCGGTGAGKTHGIIPVLINYALSHKNQDISIVSESVLYLRKGVIKDFTKIMKELNRYNDESFNKTTLTYAFKNNSTIEFFSVDQENKVRGPRRDILYINECNNINFETYFQLAIRTSDTIWLDYNPVGEFWVHEEILKDEDPDVDLITLNYKDNEALAPAVVKEIEKAKTKANPIKKASTATKPKKPKLKVESSQPITPITLISEPESKVKGSWVKRMFKRILGKKK